MKSLNRVTLIGNVGQDPETRYLPDGASITNLSIATSESWKDKNTGEAQERTEWHKCIAFRKLAEIISQYVHKGDKLFVEGKLQTRKWEKDGTTHYSTEIILDNMLMLGGKRETGTAGGQPNRKADYRAPANKDIDFDDLSDPIPF